MENLLIGAREASNELKHARKSGASKSSVNATSSLGVVQASFKEFMQKLGSNAGKNINVAVDNSGIGKIGDSSGRQLNRSENDYSRSDDYSRSARPVDDGNRGGDYGDRSRAESRRDDRGRDGSSGRTEATRDDRRGDGRTASTEGAAANRQQNTRTGDRPDGRDSVSKAPGDNQGSNDGSAKSGQTTGKKADNEDSTKGGKAQDASSKDNIAQDKSKKPVGNDISTVDTAIIVAASTAINLINTGQVRVSPTNSSLSSPLAGAGKNDIAEQVLGQNISKTKTKNSGAKVAGNILAKVGTKSDGKANIEAKAGVAAKTGVKADNAKTGAKTGANTNSAANQQSLAGSDMDPAFKSRLAQQAAGISKSVGTGTNVKVSVNVTKESETLVSRPASTLISQLAISGGNAKQTRNGKSSVSNGNKAAAQISRQAKGDIGQAVDKQAKAQLSQLRPDAASQGKGPVQLASKNSANSQQTTLSSGGDTLLTGGPGGAGDPGQSQQSTATKTETPKRAAFVRRPTINQISVQISKAVAAGVDKINIQLKPASLGRVEVSLEVAKNGHVSAVVIADNKNTLDLLQNGSDELKQALQNAGLNTDSGSLSFGLREESHSSGGRDGGAGRSADGNGSARGGDGSAEADIAAIRNTDIITNSKVDVRA